MERFSYFGPKSYSLLIHVSSPEQDPEPQQVLPASIHATKSPGAPSPSVEPEVQAIISGLSQHLEPDQKMSFTLNGRKRGHIPRELTTQTQKVVIVDKTGHLDYHHRRKNIVWNYWHLVHNIILNYSRSKQPQYSPRTRSR